MLERLNLTELAQKTTALNLQKTIKEITDEIDRNLQLVSEKNRQILANELNNLQEKFISIQTDFSDGKATLLTSLNRLRDALNSLIETFQQFLPSEQTDEREVANFIAQVESLKNDLFYPDNPSDNNADYNNTDELMRRLQPSLAQILALVAGKNEEIYQAYQEIDKDINAIRKRLPESLQQSLADLARRAHINLTGIEAHINTIEAEIYQFKTEIQVWFDRSMDRASGVYKRNAKGVAVIIGFLLALAVNADTFHMVSRLTTDAVLRDALVKNATLTAQVDCPVSQTNPDASTQLECLREKVNQSLPLPIGRDEVNLKQQVEESKHWFFPPLRSFLGWLVSGLAIAMGAPFWFDLLGKVVNVRNSGKPPAKTTERNSAG